MEHFKPGKYRIEYKDFNNLLVAESWLLHERMNDNWTAQDHLEYIDNIVCYNPYFIVEFYVDNLLSKEVSTIDVLIKPSGHDKNLDSKPHHIKFIKDYHKTKQV